MTIQEAIEHCRQYDNHEWVYQVAVNDDRGDSPYEDDRINGRSSYDNATIVVGGCDRLKSIACARATGYHGPIVHWDRI